MEKTKISKISKFSDYLMLYVCISTISFNTFFLITFSSILSEMAIIDIIIVFLTIIALTIFVFKKIQDLLSNIIRREVEYGNMDSKDEA